MRTVSRCRCCGLFGKIMIFDQPLTDRQIADLTAAEKLLKKE